MENIRKNVCGRESMVGGIGEVGREWKGEEYVGGRVTIGYRLPVPL